MRQKWEQKIFSWLSMKSRQAFWKDKKQIERRKRAKDGGAEGREKICFFFHNFVFFWWLMAKARVWLVIKSGPEWMNSEQSAGTRWRENQAVPPVLEAWVNSTPHKPNYQSCSGASLRPSDLAFHTVATFSFLSSLFPLVVKVAGVRSLGARKKKKRIKETMTSDFAFQIRWC